MDKLLLGVSFLGFEPGAIRLFKSLMGSFGRQDCAWQATSPREADVWCVNAAALEPGESGDFLVRSLDEDGLPERLALSRAPGLIALAGADAGRLPGAIAFDPLREASVIAAFRTLESRLAVLRCDYALGCSLAWHQEEVAAGGVYQLHFHSRLVAVMDLSRRIAAFPLTALPEDLLRAEWVRRPLGAGRAPDAFVSRNPAELLWLYAMRTALDILPTRYRRKPVFFVQMPRIPIERLAPDQIRLLVMLRAGPAPLSDLARRLNMPELTVARWLTALHSAGAISTTAPPEAPAHEPLTSPVTTAGQALCPGMPA